MIKIRKGTFETNSSSTHAIVFSQDKENLFQVNKIDFKIGRFGLKKQKLNTLDEKASYLYTAILDCFGKKSHNQYVNKLKELLKVNNIEYTFQEPIWNNNGFLDNGYIDHAENLKDFIKFILSDVANLLCYLLNDKSFIITDNDSMFDEYNEEILKEIDYKYISKKINTNNN